MESITLNAHAKINLSLEVAGKRDDGYHNIVSLMQGIGLCDTIEIKKCAGNGTKYNLPHCTLEGLVVYLCTDEKTIPTDMSNLAFKGIGALLNACEGRKDLIAALRGESEGLLLSIEKKLPVAAGIAGGSADGAASMLALNAMMGHPMSLTELMEIGAAVGADVPFSIFMNAYRNRYVLKDLNGIDEVSDAAWISGIGDVVEAADPMPYHVLLANPGIAVSTRDAYEAMDETDFDKSEAARDKALFVNDLEQYTLEAYPEAAKLKQVMTQLLMTDTVLMSGSGPTMVAYYQDKKKAEADFLLMERLSSNGQGVRTWLTTTGIIQ